MNPREQAAGDAYLPDRATEDRARDQAASDAAATRLEKDVELKALLKQADEAAQAERNAPGPPAPPSTGHVHIEDARPNPVLGHLTAPRAYINPGSPALLKGAPTVKVGPAVDELTVVTDGTRKHERRWPVLLFVASAVLTASFFAIVKRGNGRSTEAAAPPAPEDSRHHADPAPLPEVAQPASTELPALPSATVRSRAEPPSPRKAAPLVRTTNPEAAPTVLPPSPTPQPAVPSTTDRPND